MAEPGEEQIIKKVGGTQELRQHLADMGFVPGGGVTVISTIGGNVIVRVKESRVDPLILIQRVFPQLRGFAGERLRGFPVTRELPKENSKKPLTG